MEDLTVKDLIRILTNLENWDAKVCVLIDNKQVKFDIFEDTTTSNYLELVVENH